MQSSYFMSGTSKDQPLDPHNGETSTALNALFIFSDEKKIESRPKGQPKE